MGLALLVIIWLITLTSSYFFAIQKWSLPTLASVNGAAIDAQFANTYIWMGIVFLAAQLALGFFVWKFRDREGSKATYIHGNTKMEVVWTILTAALFLWLNLSGNKIWAESRFVGASSGAQQVEVSGVQFQWYFRYPGPDRKFGHTSLQNLDASAGNEAAVGLDTTDPASKDDYVVGTMVLPVNQEAELILRAQDVIHSFFIPAMRFKQDAVPGLMIHMHFTPNRIGDYDIACAELCGLGHYRMKAKLRVVSEQDFAKWQAERLAEKQQ